MFAVLAGHQVGLQNDAHIDGIELFINHGAFADHAACAQVTFNQRRQRVDHLAWIKRLFFVQVHLDIAFLTCDRAQRRWRSTENYTPQNVVGNAGNYNCDRMLAVWNAARCMNFFDQTQDRFHDFQYLTSNDPRRLPTVCPNNGVTAEWINRAFNNEANRYVLQAENPMDNTPYTTDPMASHLNRINPVGTAPANNCAAPIPTGVVVFRQGGSPEYYNEKVCPNPGCYYVPSGSGGSASSPSDSGNCQQ